MGRLNHKRVLWMWNRAYLRDGAWVWLTAAAVAAVLFLSVAVATTAWRSGRVENERRALAGALLPARAAASDGVRSAELPLPLAASRFAITRRMLDTLQKTGFEPEQIRFKFENADEAALTRQIAVFTVKAQWGDIARLLAQLQRAERAAYISRLRVVREHAQDPQVEAEIQLAVVLRDDEAAASGAAR